MRAIRKFYCYSCIAAHTNTFHSIKKTVNGKETTFDVHILRK
jgi:hypothetical protein